MSFNIVPFKGNTLCITSLQLFDTIFVVRFHLCLKIDLSFGDHLFIRRKFLPSEHSFEIREQEIVVVGQIWRMRWMRKQFGAQFMDFGHLHFHCLVTLCIVFVKQNFFFDKCVRFSAISFFKL